MPWRATGPGDITVLDGGSARLTKLITPDGIVDYDNATFFAVDAYRLAGIEDVEGLLRELTGQQHRCVIRAALNRLTVGHVRRLIRAADAPFTEHPRSWAMIDIEPESAPPYVD